MIFLGSFYVDVTLIHSSRVILFKAYNEASLVSAMHFRRERDVPPGVSNKAGIIDSHERGKGIAPLGGTLALEWVWTERFR